jgi:hypothetical protein
MIERPGEMTEGKGIDRSFWSRWVPPALIGVLIILLFYKFVLFGMIPINSDWLVNTFEPWKSALGNEQISYEYNHDADPVILMYPMKYVTVRLMKDGVLPIVRDANRYHQFFSLGFGVWMDEDWRKKGWDEKDLSKNFYPPEAFEASVRRALEVADEYVWIYTETPRWWSAEGKSVKLPGAYEAAVRRARAGLAKN